MKGLAGGYCYIENAISDSVHTNQKLPIYSWQADVAVSETEMPFSRKSWATPSSQKVEEDAGFLSYVPEIKSNQT